MIDYLKKFQLDNKTAFVVGGLGLIGREVSSAFASVGAKTVILDLKNKQATEFEEDMRETGHELIFRSFDCMEMDLLEKNFSDLLNEFLCPDVFVNCSYPQTMEWGKGSFPEVTFTSFRENVDYHMNSFAWLARLVAEKMVKDNKQGSIIQLGSIYGMVGQDLTVYENTKMEENMIYAPIKGGIISLTRLMASYYGRFNIRVNTLCPGGLEGHVAGKSDTQDPIFVEQYSNKTPLKRMGRAEEVAAAALFLASDAASYITGTTLMVDGGWTAV